MNILQNLIISANTLLQQKNSDLEIAEESNYYKTAQMFHVTNTACIINLEDNKFDFRSGIFLDDSSQNQWGNEGSNGRDVELNTNNEEIDGDIIVNSISKLKFNMKTQNLMELLIPLEILHLILAKVQPGL